MVIKKIPLRMCLGCQEMKPKKELIRVVKNKEGIISIDKRGKSPGRGAYICNSLECLQKAQKQKRLERAFSGAIDKEIYEQLVKELMENE
jgi:uncharacterized protein